MNLFIAKVQYFITLFPPFISAAIDWMGDFAELLYSNTVIFVFAAAVPLVGLGIGLMRRLLNS